MALAILDGTQTATTLSTILSSGQHITAHTVVSLGTQAITDMRSAVSGSVVSISNFPATQAISIASVTIGNSVTISSLPAITGTVTANLNTPNFVGTEGDPSTLKSVALGFYSQIESEFRNVDDVNNKFPVNAGTINGLQDGDGTTFGVDRNFPVDVISALPAGTNRIGVVTASLSAGTAQIGSVTASISGTVPVSGTFFQGTQPVSLTTLPALVAGTAQIGSVTASISNSVTIAAFTTSVTARLINPAGTAVTYAEVGTAGNPSIDVLSVQGVTAGTPLNVYPMQGTTISNTNFTSTTASTSLVSAVTGREVLTIFSEGPGNLFVSPGATATTISYQVRLSAGDYWECPAGQLSLGHVAVFATAGTARVCQVS